jgi:hypothetical protein
MPLGFTLGSHVQFFFISEERSDKRTGRSLITNYTERIVEVDSIFGPMEIKSNLSIL